MLNNLKRQGNEITGVVGVRPSTPPQRRRASPRSIDNRPEN
jgi:hypothetical protein